MITAHGDVEAAVEAMQAGAAGFLQKQPRGTRDWRSAGISVAVSTKTATVVTNMATTKRPTARWTVSSGTVRPQSEVAVEPRIRDHASSAISATVVVLAPPAVEPGLPPTNISSTVRKLDASVACP